MTKFNKGFQIMNDLFKYIQDNIKVHKELRAMEAKRLDVLIEEMKTLQDDIFTLGVMEDTIGEMMSLLCLTANEPSVDDGEAFVNRIPVLIGEHSEMVKNFRESIAKRMAEDEEDPDPKPSKNALRKARRHGKPE